MRIHYTGLTFACPIRVTAPNRGQTVRVPDPLCPRKRINGSTAIGRVDIRLSEGLRLRQCTPGPQPRRCAVRAFALPAGGRCLAHGHH